MQKKVYFISHSTYPMKDTGGGSIVIYRHLKRLEESGFKIIFIHSLQAPPSKQKTEFNEIKIIKKRWFPPLRAKTPFLTWLRIKLYMRIVTKKIAPKDGDIILSTLGDYTNLLALSLSKKFRIPLFLIYHDNNLFNSYFNGNPLTKKWVTSIIKHSRHIFAVSFPMKKLLVENGADNVSVLYPIPHGIKKDKPFFLEGGKLSLFYSGAIFEEFHYDIIKRIGKAAMISNTQFKILSKLSEKFKKKYCDITSINFEKPITESEILYQKFINEAKILLVFYSFDADKELRMFHSFPSKFVEYCHLGLPILIIAPNFSSIGKWALENKWLSYLPTDDIEQISELIKKFYDKEFWYNCQVQSLTAAETQFNPEKIQQLFQNHLTNT